MSKLERNPKHETKRHGDVPSINGDVGFRFSTTVRISAFGVGI